MIVKCTVPRSRVVYSATDHTIYSVLSGDFPAGTVHFHLRPSQDGEVRCDISLNGLTLDVFVYLPKLTPVLYPPPKREEP